MFDYLLNAFFCLLLFVLKKGAKTFLHTIKDYQGQANAIVDLLNKLASGQQTSPCKTVAKAQ
jgi:hypothetical protein